MNRFNWSPWFTFERTAIRSIGRMRPGAYQIRCLGRHKRPVVIERAWRKDLTGLVYIGRSKKSVRSRIRSFYHQAKGSNRKGHIAAKHYLRFKFARIFPLKRLQFRYALMSAHKAEQAEKRLILAYLRKHFDAPPLNFQIPVE